MYLSKFGDPLTFPLAPPTGQTLVTYLNMHLDSHQILYKGSLLPQNAFHFLVEISQQLLACLFTI